VINGHLRFSTLFPSYSSFAFARILCSLLQRGMARRPRRSS
jgi:hypothetical protein